MWQVIRKRGIKLGDGIKFAWNQLPSRQGDDPGLNAQVMRAMFFGGKGFRRDFAVLNAGAALYIGGAAGSIEMGITMANEAIDSGRADLVLNLLADFTN